MIRLGGRLMIACIFVTTVFGWQGVGAQDDGEDGVAAPFGDPGQAFIRVVHASPDAPALDLYAGDRVVASGLVAGDATGFLTVPDGEQGLRFVPAGGAMDSAIVETRFTLVDGGAYEVVALGQLREIDGRIYEIDRTRFEGAGMARVRFLHLSPDADQVDVVAGDDHLLFEGVDFADAAGYIEVEAGLYALRLRSSDPVDVDAGAQAMAESELVLSAGEVYDILAVGLTHDATFGLLPLAATTEQPCGDLLGAGGPEDSCIRVVHASADTPAFDLFVDDGELPLATGIGFAESSGFVPIPAGKHTVRLAATETDAGDTLRETKIDVDAGVAYDLAAVDLLEQLDVRAIELDLSPLGAGQARLRMVHAMPNQSGLTLGLASGEEIFGDVQFPDVSPALEIPAGTLDLEVWAATVEATVLATEQGLDLAPGSAYVIYIIGAGDGTVARVLALTTDTDRMSAGMLPGELD